MTRTPRHCALAVAWWALSCPPAGIAQAGDTPPDDPAVVPASLSTSSLRVPPRSKRPESLTRTATTAGWWLGPVGIAAALAVVGGVSLASKRYNLNLGLGLNLAREASPIGVIGQTRLSPKHSVYLVRVGGRVLIVGTGPAGSPTTLGELTDPTEVARLIPQRPGRAPANPPTSTVRLTGTARSSGFDQRIGDDE